MQYVGLVVFMVWRGSSWSKQPHP